MCTLNSAAQRKDDKNRSDTFHTWLWRRLINRLMTKYHYSTREGSKNLSVPKRQ